VIPVRVVCLWQRVRLTEDVGQKVVWWNVGKLEKPEAMPTCSWPVCCTWFYGFKLILRITDWLMYCCVMLFHFSASLISCVLWLFVIEFCGCLCVCLCVSWREYSVNSPAADMCLSSSVDTAIAEKSEQFSGI